MASVSPLKSTWVNIAVGVAGVVVVYASKTDLPPPWPHDWAVIVKAQAAWFAGLGSALAAAGVLNTFLHAVSSDDAGPLAK